MNATIALPAGILTGAARTPERWERGLSRREVFGLDAGQPLHLSCLDGVLWITVDGDPADYVLQAGQGMPLPAGRTATIQALQAGRFGVGRG